MGNWKPETGNRRRSASWRPGVLFAVLLIAPIARAQSQPASQPNIREFKKGIRVNWTARQVVADCTVIMREGAIELFACAPNQREHEAIVRLEARPLDLYHALGLIGLEPGHPIRLNEQTQQVEKATGDPIDIQIRYERDGQKMLEPIEKWMQYAQDRQLPENQRKPAKPLPIQPWIFAGSLKTEDGFAADGEGTVIALVDFGTSLIALPEMHTSNNDALWLDPAPQHIPPVGTRCELVFSAGPLQLAIGPAGRLQLNSRPVTRAELAKRLSEELRAKPDLAIRLLISPDAPATERQAIERLLRAVGVDEKRITTSQPAVSMLPPHDPAAMQILIRQALETPRQQTAGERRVAESTHQLTDDLRDRAFLLRARTERVAEYLVSVRREVEAFLSGEPATPQEKGQIPDTP